jgi:hypothetical protein
MEAGCAKLAGAWYRFELEAASMFSKVLRRTHMYLGLFFMPWMLMYAVSTIAMNHRQFFLEKYGGEMVRWEKEQEQSYPGSFPSDVEARAAGGQILAHLKLEGGAFSARKDPDGRSITILRDDPVVPRRVTYTPADQKLVVEKQVFRMPAFLERMHRRRGFQSEFFLTDAWGLTVDLAITAMILWVLTGLWMWWELKTTRALGALFLAIGAALFAFFTVMI